MEASHLLPHKVVAVGKCPQMTSTKPFLLPQQGQKSARPRILSVPICTDHVSATCSVELLRQEMWVLMMHLSCKGACQTNQTHFHPITRASLPFRPHSSSPFTTWGYTPSCRQETQHLCHPPDATPFDADSSHHPQWGNPTTLPHQPGCAGRLRRQAGTLRYHLKKIDMAQAALLNGQHTVGADDAHVAVCSSYPTPLPPPNFTKNVSMRDVSMRFSQHV
jgi:hypothetical protein